jgi:signal transduction histidine kinase
MYSVSFTLVEMAECYYKIGDIKSAQKYALESYKREYELNQNRPSIRSRINFLISEIYIELGQPDKAFEYIKAYQEITTEANKTENANKVAEAEIREVIAKNETQINQFEKERTQKIQESKIQRVWIFSITGALLSALLVAFILYRNNKIKQKANKLLQEQKEEIQTTLEQLKSTQSQLIQSEKMASLGELTAGIAHEIQNPLNFVNNFSELSNELIVEVEEERAKNPESRDENLVSEILSDIKQNLEKINHHGKRAADIVKGMLQHSRTSSGVKEPTDINALADEYLRLAYHGLRAKDKSFNAEFKTEFDETLPKINVIPQDIGRVLLNLINNAYYAVDNRAKLLTPPPPEGGMKNDQIKFVPTVTISTSSLPPPSGGRGVRITVKDNGPGIPAHIIDKIFQPFFTTKPTGQGTGLGLSLAYDIVKAHGGELKVESKEGEGSEFIIQLPIF